MKKLMIFLLAGTLALSCCSCTLREVPASEQTQTSENPAKSGKPAASTAQPTGEKAEKPAVSSGSDLFVPEPWSREAADSLSRLRSRAAEAGACCAIALLGYMDSDMTVAAFLAEYDLLSENGSGDAYPFLREMTPLQCCAEGYTELYCLVPTEKGCLVVIGETELVEGEPTGPVTEVYRSDSGDPVMFTADSNGWGGSCIDLTVTTPDGSTVHCNPGIYCNLGTLAIPDEILDFTVYAD